MVPKINQKNLVTDEYKDTRTISLIPFLTLLITTNNFLHIVPKSFCQARTHFLWYE